MFFFSNFLKRRLHFPTRTENDRGIRIPETMFVQESCKPLRPKTDTLLLLRIIFWVPFKAYPSHYDVTFELLEFRSETLI